MSPLPLEDGDVSWKPLPPQQSYPEHQVEKRGEKRKKEGGEEEEEGGGVGGEKVWGEEVLGEGEGVGGERRCGRREEVWSKCSQVHQSCLVCVHVLS